MDRADTPAPFARAWGATRLVPFTGATGVPYARVELDPTTQVTRYLDLDGQVIKAAKHGTNKSQNSSNPTGGGDGKNPEPPDDINVTDYVPD